MNEQAIQDVIKQVTFDKQGLVTAVVQDHADAAVLMVAYMNAESLAITLREGKVCFWSRSRKKLWRKGEESGNVQNLKRLSIDCDGDCLRVTVEQVGGAACHTGYRTCFYRTLDSEGNLTVTGRRVFDPDRVYKK